MTKEREAHQGPELGKGAAEKLEEGVRIPIPAANYTSQPMSSGFNDAHCNETSGK